MPVNVLLYRVTVFFTEKLSIAMDRFKQILVERNGPAASILLTQRIRLALAVPSRPAKACRLVAVRPQFRGFFDQFRRSGLTLVKAFGEPFTEKIGYLPWLL